VPSSHDAATYLRALQALGCEVDAWETTYLHVLEGEDPVFTWVSGTGARPTLQALPADLRVRFEEEFKKRLRAAYPDHDGRVVLPFRRIFVVGQVAT
jgi:trans-aconitate 2-methyltransferase